MAADLHGLQQLAKEGFYKAPSVVIITGNTNRRLHALSVFADTLRTHGHSVDCLSYSFTREELQKMKPYGVDYIQEYDLHLFKELYKKHEAPSSQKSFICIEMDIDILKDFAFAQHNVRTILVTDVFMTSKEAGEELIEMLDSALKKATTLQTIVSNDDVHQSMSSDLHFVPLDLVHVARHHTFGTTPISTYHFTEREESIELTENGEIETCAVPLLSQYSLIKREGVLAALALLHEEGVWKETIVAKGFPLIESSISAKIEYYWMGEETTKEEIHAIFQGVEHVCLGVSVYLAFEDVIEEYVEMMGSVLVVAENIAESALFTEYFVKKEKDSFHSVVYTADATSLKYLVPPLFQESKVVYMFGHLDSFTMIT